MAQLLSGSFSNLRRYLGIAGGLRGLNDIATSSPVQPVLDLTREAQLGIIETHPGAGGYFQIGQDNVHAAADTQETSIVPTQALAATWVGADGERWIWMINAWVSTTATGILTSAQLSLGVPAIGGALALRDMLIRNWNGELEFHDTQSSTFDVAGLLENRPLPCDFPLLIPNNGANGARLGFRSVSAAAGTIRLMTICWVGPIGVYPPGMA